MNNEALRELAEKLGVGVSALWGALLRQAPIEGAIDIVWSLMLIAVGTFLARRYVRHKDEWRDQYYDGEFSVLAVQTIITVGGLAICALVLSTTLVLGLAGLFNPDYWALHKVLSLLGE